MALKRLCRCKKLIEYNKEYCDECSKKYIQERKEYQKYYDQYIRDKDAAEFYNSKEWETTREYIISKYKGLDLYAFFIEKKILYANTIHHIEEIRDNWERKLDVSNLIPLSASNHARIHKMYERDKENTQKLLFDLLERWCEVYE